MVRFSDTRVEILQTAGWKDEQATFLAQRLPHRPTPSSLLLPSEISLDSSSDEVGVFFATGYLSPLDRTFQESWDFLLSRVQEPLKSRVDIAVGEAHGKLPQEQRIRLGWSLRRDSENVYLECRISDQVETLFNELGGDGLTSSLEKVRLILGPAVFPEGVGIRVAGRALGKMKLYLPIRGSTLEILSRALLELAGQGWASTLCDALRIIAGSHNICESGRVILTISSGHSRPGLALYVRDLIPGDAAAWGLAILAGARLGTPCATLTRFLNDSAGIFPWANLSSVTFIAVEPESQDSSRLRIWLRAEPSQEETLRTSHDRGDSRTRIQEPSRSIEALGPFDRQLRRAQEQALHFLVERQHHDGRFHTVRSKARSLQDPLPDDDGIFTTAFISLTLCHVEGDQAGRLLGRSLDFLRGKMDAQGMWKYSSRKGMGLPWPDLDDTACASFALLRFAGDPLYSLNLKALLANRREDGLFRTWLAPPEVENDTDSIVNANVLLYLGQQPETAQVVDYLNTLIRENREEGSFFYYTHKLFLYQAMSRAFWWGARGLSASRDVVIQRLFQTKDPQGRFCSPLLTGLAASTFFNYGFSDRKQLESILSWLLGTQASDGSWPREAAWAGPLPPGPHSVWWGSEELTTAICLEALARYCGQR